MINPRLKPQLQLKVNQGQQKFPGNISRKYFSEIFPGNTSQKYSPQVKYELNKKKLFIKNKLLISHWLKSQFIVA